MAFINDGDQGSTVRAALNGLNTTTVLHIANVANPHAVTASQAGALANVANVVTSSLIAANAVETAKIADGNVTAAKLNADVNTAYLANAAGIVLSSHMAANSVLTAAIADLNVTSGKIEAAVTGVLPNVNQKAALVGTSGTEPSAANPLVDNADTRLSDVRVPAANSVTPAMLTPDANALFIANSAGSVLSTHMAANAVLTAAIADGNVTSGKIDTAVTALFPNTDQKAALVGVSGGVAPSVSNPFAQQSYVDSIIDAANSMVYKGAENCASNPDYPAANAGWMWLVSDTGKIGGASGEAATVGDMLICNTDATPSGDSANVAVYWNIIHKNEGAVIGPASAVIGNFASYNAVTGKVVVDSAFNGTSFDTNGAASSAVSSHNVASIHVNSDIQAAFAGTSGTPPSASNFLVDNADTRMTNTRTPSAHNLFDNVVHTMTGLTPGYVATVQSDTSVAFAAPGGGAVAANVISISDNYTANTTDTFIIANTDVKPITVTMWLAAGNAAKSTTLVRLGANTASIATAAGETVSRTASPFNIVANTASAAVTSDNVNFVVTNSFTGI